MMKNEARTNRAFWCNAALVGVSLAGMAILMMAANVIHQIPNGRFPATIISVMGSREVLDNPGVTGYYERLFAATQRIGKNYIYDHSFRIYRFKPNLTWQHDLLTTNSFGLVGPECSQRKPPNTRRIALLGSSIASGHMVKASQTFGALLEDRLNAVHADAPSPRFEILNFATIAYTLPQILDVSIEEAPRFEPDVYMLDLNELGVFRSWDRHLVQLIQMGIDPKYDFLREVVRRSGASREDDALTLVGKLAPHRMRVVRESLLQLKSNAALHHASFLVVLVPAVEAGDLSKNRFDGIRELLASLHITYIDLLDTFDGILDTASLCAFPGDVHPNARGHTMIFENLYSKLRAQPDAWAALVGHGAESSDRARASSTGNFFYQ